MADSLRNKRLEDALAAYKRRNRLYSSREAIISIMTQAGYERPDRFYDFLNCKRKPSGDNRVRLAHILRRSVEELWPVDELKEG